VHATDIAIAFAAAGSADEDLWSWSSCVVPVELDKGYVTVLVKVTANIKADDTENAKLLIPSGSLWVVAVR
jgi:hypothetical protein